MTLVVYGVYNSIVWNWLEQNDATPTFAPGDEDALKNAHPDFIGFNYYNTATVAADDGTVPENSFGGDQQSGGGTSGMYKSVRNPNLGKTEFGWEIDPVGFRATIREMDSRYHLPLLVTENGLGAYDTLEDGKVHDTYRINYLRQHIAQIQEAITDGAQMLGYNPWSAIDLISTHEGMRKRYGFIFVDRDEFDLKTMKRYLKDSGYWYKKVIETNGADLSD